MKLQASQRLTPSPAAVDNQPQKKIRLHEEIDIRRWQALNKFWSRQLARGVEMNLARLGRKKGHEDGNMASQILNGHCAMNIEWMLYFAQEMGSVPPQLIWKKDWPFPDLTPDLRPWGYDPARKRTGRRFGRIAGKHSR